MKTDLVREAFETWASGENLARFKDGEYKSTQIQNGWIAWKAAADRFSPSDELNRLSEIGRQWESDSSLEKWFPITASNIACVRSLLEPLGSQPIPSVLAIREALLILRRL